MTVIETKNLNQFNKMLHTCLGRKTSVEFVNLQNC